MMNRIRRLSGALAATTLLIGCPFSSKVPIGRPSPRAIEPELIGYWIGEDPMGKEEPMLMEVLPFNESEMLFELFEKGRAPGRYRAFAVEIAGETFWNVNLVESVFPPKEYVFARTRLLADNRLSLMLVGDGVPERLARDAEGLVEYLAEHVNDSRILDEKGPLVLRRPRPGEVLKGRLASW